MNGITRRDLLKQLTVGSLLAAAPAAFFTSPGRAVYQPFAQRLNTLFYHQQSAYTVGRRYLALVPQEADVMVLTARIAGSMPHYLRLTGADTPTLRKLLAQQQRDDFAEGRTVMLDGWVLSCTEARLCALAAL